VTDSRGVPPDILREVIREVVREVIREVVAEEVAAVGLASSGRPGATHPARTAVTSGPGGRIDRGALTVRRVRAAGREGTITIGRAVVITPLAKDTARAMGVTIIRLEE